jgi:hemoglobin/transferrin/lactoferrin receptor protein
MSRITFRPLFSQKPLSYCITVITFAAASSIGLPVLAQSPITSATNSSTATTAESARKRYDIPAGSLGPVLSNFAAQAGVLLSFDPAMTAGKQSTGLRGEYSLKEGFTLLLSGSNLILVSQTSGGYLLQAHTPNQLPAVNVSSSYEPLNAGVSGNRRVVTAETIENIQANDLEDVFRTTPSVAVGGSVGIAEKIYVRGLEDALLNVTIDGATQQGVLFHHAGRLSIEPELLKQVGVHAGAGVATDGPGALGGAISFTTKDPEDLLRPGEKIGALLKAGYFDNTEGKKISANIFGRLNDNWSAMATLSQSDNNEITDGNGNHLSGTESEQQMGFAKIVGKLSASQTVKLSYDLREDEGIRAQRPQWIISSWNPGYPLKMERETFNLNYQLNPRDNPWLNLEVTLYDTYSELEQNVINRWGIYNGSSESQGINLRNTTQLSSHELIYGFEYRDDRVNAGPETNPREQEETGKVASVFVQDLFQITEKLLLSAGARYDDYALTDNTSQKLTSDGISPNVGASYQLTPSLSINAGYAEALRGRQTIETFLLDSRTNSPDLKPEKAENTEAGFEYHRNDFSFSGTIYRSIINDAINDQARVFHNIGDIETEGFDLRLSYDWQRVQAGLSYSNFDSELENQTSDLHLNAYDHGALGNTVGNTWTSDITYQVNSALELGWNGRLVERVDGVRTSAGVITQDSYTVQDIYAQWQIARDLKLTFTIKNVFDKYYLDHATNGDYQHIEDYEGVVGLAEPGRDIRLTLSWRL